MKKQNQKIMFQLDENLKQKLREESEKRGFTISGYIRFLIYQKLNQEAVQTS